MELDPSLTSKDVAGYKLQLQKQKQRDRIEEIKKLYFNAGRWAGGARDHVAREAFYEMNKREQ